tara:strand:+ start:225 stop:1733 length:1509 start_codon:yes stop_codon:yes gene_type:complete
VTTANNSNSASKLVAEKKLRLRRATGNPNKKMNDILIIGKRRFSLQDQLNFADYSGDRNPIHIDTIDARKTLIGYCVVHGINGLLWALECVIKQSKINFKYVKVVFIKPIPINTLVTCLWNPSERNIQLVSKHNSIFYSIFYDAFQEFESKKKNHILPVLNIKETPTVIDLGELSMEKNYQNKFGGNSKKGDQHYFELSNALGSDLMYEISLLSNIVGMQIPGLHSLFLECEIFLLDEKICSNPYYKITKKDERFGLINLEYVGCNLRSRMKTIERPHYQPKTIDEISKKVPKSIDLQNRKILVIGGSRGIGAAFAKVASILGADLSITFASGCVDANNVATEINSFCEKVVTILPLDVNSSSDIDNTSFEYDTLLYFASPKISPTEYGFDQDLFESFYTYYCKSFEAIAKRFSEQGGLTVYWPSSIFLDDSNDKFQEYVAAKSIGEKICEKLSVTTNLTVFFPRLTKISTDQTLSLMPENNSDAVDVAIDIAKLLSCNPKN